MDWHAARAPNIVPSSYPNIWVPQSIAKPAAAGSLDMRTPGSVAWTGGPGAVGLERRAWSGELGWAGLGASNERVEAHQCPGPGTIPASLLASPAR